MDIAAIIRLCRYGLILLPVLLLFAAAAFFVQIPNLGKKRTVRERLRNLKKHGKMWVMVCVLYAACFALVSILQARVENDITIGLNYAGASGGLTPNNTRFNSYDIIGDEVLEQAIEDGGLDGITAKELQATLSVDPLQAEDDDEALAEEQYYISTEYVLRYEASLKTLFLDGNQVVESVAQAFAGQFYDRYSRKTDALEMDEAKVDEADYLDKVNILDRQISGVQNFLWKCSAEGENYVSEDGETFASLAKKISDYQTVELERIRAYILTKGLSSDEDRQLAKLEYENLIKDLNYQKNTADYEVRLETIEMYERDMATIVLVPTTDEEGEFYMSRTKIAVDDFADEADVSSQTAAKTLNEIENNRYAISQLAGTEASETDFETADGMIASFQETLSGYADQAMKMAVDFDAKTKGNYIVLTSDQDKFFKGLVRRGGMLTGAMLFSTALVIMAFPVSKKKRTGRVSE